MILDFVHVNENSEYLLRAYIDEAIENVHWGTTLSMVFLVSYGNFRMTLLMNEWTNMSWMMDGVHPLAKILPSLVSNLWWNTVMGDWNLDEKFTW